MPRSNRSPASPDAPPERRPAAEPRPGEYTAVRRPPLRLRRERGRMPWWATVVAVITGLLALLMVAGRLDLWPGNPFGTETKDHSGPALLKSIRDMSDYDAAAGNFQVVVDLEKDAKFLPDAIKGNRTLFVGAGTVEASVNLGGLDEDAVTVTDDRKSATIRLPHATLAEATLDADRSYAVNKQRGVLDRLGDVFSDNPNDERQVHRLAVQHINEAAEESNLVPQAEKNTRAMLENLLHSLGFTDVTVTFGDDSDKGKGGR